jgi:hypothetical protein
MENTMKMSFSTGIATPATTTSPARSGAILAAWSLAGLSLFAAPFFSGCSNGITATTPPVTPVVSQSYVGPNMKDGTSVLNTYSIDRTAKTFVRESYDPKQGNERYVRSSGGFDVLSQGVLGIGITYSCEIGGNICGGNGVNYSPPQTGSWAIELPGQAALVQVLGTPFVPLASNMTCPTATTAQNFQFVTIPSPLSSKTIRQAWNPLTDTAFGSFSLTASASTVTFSNVSQSTLPVAGGPPGVPSNPSPASVTGVCSSTFYGQTISVPTSQNVTFAGSNPPTTLPTATIAVGSSGFLVEDNGTYSTLSGVADADPYQNLLGAGIGAVGLAQPASALKTSDVVGAQYTGFLYGSGTAVPNVPSTSRIASFGLTGQQTACPTLPAQTGTLIYGGEFTDNKPSAANAAGICDVAIDLGTQDAKTNGLYPAAKVYVSGTFPGNKGGKGSTYSFSAVAIAGQLTGKNAIMLIGLDTLGTPKQAWGIYLLQSN